MNPAGFASAIAGVTMSETRTERQWKWWAGPDDERFTTGPCDTREQVIAEALDDIGMTAVEIDPDDDHPGWRVQFSIVEATKYELQDISLNGERVIEDLENGPCEDWYDPDGDGLFGKLTREHFKDLSDSLTIALGSWIHRHELPVEFWAFRGTRNHELIVLPHPDNKP